METKHIISGITALCLILSITLLSSCKDDEVTASIVGKWQGDKSEVTALAAIIPVYSDTDENFDDMVEFKADGTGTANVDGSDTSGTWEWVEVNKKLRVSIDFKTTLLEPTEVYTVKELTATKLTLFLEKDGTYQDPETGNNFSGKVKATLYFNRVN
jgi:hypothetical protein